MSAPGVNMAEDKAIASSAAPADGDSLSGGSEGHQDNALKTTLYRTLRFQAFLQEFRDPDVRNAFLAGHFGVEDNSEVMLSCIDKILDLILPSLRWEDNPWDTTSRTGVTFITDMMDGMAGEPTDKDGNTLPLRKSFDCWMQYFGKLRKAAYWQTFGSNGGACGSGKESAKGFAAGGECALASRGRADVQDRTTFFPPLKHSSPVRRATDASVPEQSGPTVGISRGRVPLFQGDGPLANFPQHKQTGQLPDASKLRSKVLIGEPISTFQNYPNAPPGKSAYSPGGLGSSSGESSRDSRPLPGARQSSRKQYRAGRVDTKLNVPIGQLRQEVSRKTERRHCGESRSRRGRINSHRMRVGSSSSETSAGTESTDSSRCSSESETDHRREHAMSQMFREMRFPRDVVAPVLFEGLDGTSLKRFFSDFERYFKEKYNGTDRQCSQLLAEFLSGPARQAYDALGGPTAKYSQIKPKLLKWYKSERVSQRHSAEEEFYRASMEDTESLTIYALRLERLAGIAFPDTRREQERQLCRKFWRTAPSQFTELMVGSERSLALTGKRTLRWKDMKRLAEVEDRHARRMKTEPGVQFQKPRVWFSSSRNPQPLLQHAVDFGQQSDGFKGKPPGQRNVRFKESTPASGAPQGISWRRRDSSRGGRGESRGERRSMCNWCGKAGHLEERCWEKKGLCVVCGSEDHAEEGCPRSHFRFSPICSICKGDHLGRNCPQHPLN